MMVAFDTEKQSSRTVVSIDRLHPQEIHGGSGAYLAIVHVRDANGKEIDMRPLVDQFGHLGRRESRMLQSSTTYIIGPTKWMHGLIQQALTALGYEVLLDGEAFPESLLPR